MKSVTKISNVPTIRSIGSSFAETAPDSKEHLAVYIALVLGYKIPNKKVCENHVSPLDAIWDAYSEQTHFDIWHAMRGSGKTQDLAILTWLESVFKPQCGTTILGGSFEQSTKIVQYLSELWDRPQAPRHMLKNGQVAGRGYRLTNGSWVTALAASQKSVRGPHPQKLALDEVDEMDKELYFAALGQPKAAYGIPDRIIASSTLHHAYGLMSEIVDNRDTYNAGLKRWCTEELTAPYGFWTKEELDRKKAQMPDGVWKAEYLLERPTSKGSVYDWDSIERAYERGKKITGIDRDVPVQAGIDWGYTVTVMHVIQDDGEKVKIPETHRWENVELNERCKEIVDICEKYNITNIYADSNPKDNNITLGQMLKKRQSSTKLHPVAFSKWKDIGISVTRYMLENNMVDIKSRVAKEKMQKYHFRSEESEIVVKEDDHDPDALIAWMASKHSILGR